MSGDSPESHITVQEEDSSDSSSLEDFEDGSNLTRLARAIGIRPAIPSSATTTTFTASASSRTPAMAPETPRFVYRQADLPLFDIETDRNEAFLAWKLKWDDYCDLSHLVLEPQSRQVRVLRRCMSSPTLTVLQNLGIPDDPTQTTTKQILETLQEYVAKSINVNIEWNNLMSRSQAPNESIDDYVLALRQIVKGCDTCKGAECADRAVRVQLVRGVRDSEVTKELLKQTELTLKKAVEIARSLESAKSDSGAIHNGKNNQGPEVNQMSSFKKSKKSAKQAAVEEAQARGRGDRPRGEERGGRREDRRPENRQGEDHYFEGRRGENRRQYRDTGSRCAYCGRGAHADPRQCPAYNERCDFCRKIGHFKRVCPDRRQRIAALDARDQIDDFGAEQPFQGALQALTTPTRQSYNFMEFAHDPHFYHIWMPSLSAIETAPKAWVRAASCPTSEATNVLVLPDTGADITAVDIKFLRRCNIRGPLMPPTINAAGAANGSLMKPIGTIRVCWRHENKFVLDDVHVFEEVTTPLLGWRISEALELVTYNFRKVFLKTDPQAQRITGASTNPTELKEAPTPEDVEQVRQSLLNEFKEVFSDQIKSMKGEEFEINLSDNSVPFRVTAPRAVPLAYKEALKDELRQLREQDIIEPVTYPTDWCSPIVVEPKNEGVRLCVDFTKLNRFVRREYYTVEPPAKQVAAIAKHQAKFFTSLDAVKGYHQCPLKESSRDLTTFITPFGRFRYKRAPFGISSISEHYNRRMDENLTLSADRTRRVVDDLAAFDATFPAHVQHIRDILQQCRNKGITLSKKKFVFAQPSLKFAGFIISEHGYTIDPTITSAIAEFPAPKNVTDVRAFMGLVNQLSGLRHDIARLVAPIRPLLSPKNEFIWTEDMDVAFQAAKEALCKQPFVAYFDLNKDTRIITDASRQGLGFVMQQYDDEDGQWCTVQAGSRSLLDCETRYAVIELEMLAVCFAVRKTSTFITGLKVQVVTDHKPLVSILNDRRMDEIDNPRLRRMREFLAQFQLTAEHIQGKKNTAADALSRYPMEPPPKSTILTKNLIHEAVVRQISMSQSPCTMEYYDELEQALVKASRECDQYQGLKQLLLTTGFPHHRSQLAPELRVFWPMKEHLALHQAYTRKELLVFCGRRALVPRTMRKHVLETLHSSHQGEKRMQQLARHFVYWPSIDSDIAAKVQDCQACRRFAPANKKPPLCQPELPTRPFQDVSMDLFQLGSRHFLAVVDAFSLWPELVMFPSCPTSIAVSKACAEIWARFGAPNVCRTDNGPQFRASAFANFLQLTFTRHITSAPYYPQSNGRAEAVVKVLKNIVKKASFDTGSVYDARAVTQAIWIYRNTPTSDGLSPAEKVFGRPTRNPVMLSATNDNVVSHERADQAFLKRKHEQKAVEARYNVSAHPLGLLKINDLVRVRNHVNGEYDIQGRVVQINNNERRIKIELPNGVLLDRDRRHVKLCRPVITPLGGHGYLNTDLSFDESRSQSKEIDCGTGVRKCPSAPGMQSGPLRRSSRIIRKPDRFRDSAYSTKK